MSYNPSEFFKSSKPLNTEVKTSFDPRVITKKQAMSSDEIENYKREAVRGTGIGNKTAEFGLSSSMGKSDRLFALQNGISSGRIKTVKEASIALSVQENTIKKYLRELSITFDFESGGINKLKK